MASAALVSFSVYANATYSIVACDLKTRECGVAVQTNNLAVGASVPYAQAGVGAVASQFETNPMHGPRGLALMAGGKNPAETLQQLLREDGNFDGEGIEARQVGIVAVDSRAAFYTGREAADSNWAGARSGPDTASREMDWPGRRLSMRWSEPCLTHAAHCLNACLPLWLPEMPPEDRRRGANRSRC
jgi:hypothetical protein